MDVQGIYSDPEGCFLILQSKHEGVEFLLVYVYAPNTDSPRFFMELFRKMEDFNGKRIIMRDFNLTLDKAIDRNSVESKK